MRVPTLEHFFAPPSPYNKIIPFPVGKITEESFEIMREKRVPG
jgi:hypothetical protein